MDEQMHLDDRLDRFQNVNSAQVKKEKAETLRSFFRIPEHFSENQILAKEQELRQEYKGEIKAKEEELGLLMWNIAEGMLQQAFYGWDQSSPTSSQSQMENVLKAVSAEEARNTSDLQKYIEETKKKVIQKVFLN